MGSRMSALCPSCRSGLQIPEGCESGVCRQCGGAFLVVTDQDALYLVPLRPEPPEASPSEEPDPQPLREALEVEAAPDGAQADPQGAQEAGPGDPSATCEPEEPEAAPGPMVLPEAPVPPAPAWPVLQARVQAARVVLSRLLGRVPPSTWQTLAAGAVGALLVLLLAPGRGAPEPPPSGAVQIVPAGTLEQEALPYPQAGEPVMPAPLAPAAPGPAALAAAPGVPTPIPSASPGAPTASPSASPTASPSASPSPRLQAAPPLPAVGVVNGKAVQAPRGSRATGSRTTEPSEEASEEEEASPSPSPSAEAGPNLLGEAGTSGAKPRAGDSSSKPFLLVTRVEQSRNSVVVWAYMGNSTGRNLNYQPCRLLDPGGAQFERGSYQNWDVSGGTLKPGWFLTMWPLFEPLEGQVPGTFVLPTEEFGNLEVPAVEKMSNYGPWDRLPQKLRDDTESQLRRSEGFRWWGLSGLGSHPVPAPTTRQGPPGY